MPAAAPLANARPASSSLDRCCATSCAGCRGRRGCAPGGIPERRLLVGDLAPIEIPDEPSHFAYVQRLAETGKLPNSSAETFPPAEYTVLNDLHYAQVRYHSEQDTISTPAQQHTLERDLAKPLPRSGPVGGTGVSASSRRCTTHWRRSRTPWVGRQPARRGCADAAALGVDGGRRRCLPSCSCGRRSPAHAGRGQSADSASRSHRCLGRSRSDQPRRDAVRGVRGALLLPGEGVPARNHAAAGQPRSG